MKAAYIGILTPGSTSRMRAECLRRLTPDWTWEWVDTDPPLQNSARPWQTLAFRHNSGQAVDRINALVMDRTRAQRLDLAWVDKAVFLRRPTVERIRRTAKRLLHFTPDTAFHANRSRHFEKTIGLFDVLVTSKSFELGEYRRRVPGEKILLTTQGYDAAVHFPRGPDSARRHEALFIGLAEPDRARCVAALLARGVPVRLAGRGWKRFVHRRRNDPLLSFEGEDVFGDTYAQLLSRSWIGLGLLSKRFPEQHTTRTFEIPACGAVLATELTDETARFFTEKEALFFEDHAGLADRVEVLLGADGTASLAGLAAAGRNRVRADRRDYDNILGAILSDPRVAPR